MSVAWLQPLQNLALNVDIVHSAVEANEIDPQRHVCFWERLQYMTPNLRTLIIMFYHHPRRTDTLQDLGELRFMDLTIVQYLMVREIRFALIRFDT